MNPIGAIDPARCMKCGFCMSVCPVYIHDRVETHVARGRNMLIKMVAENRLPRDNAYRASLTYCLLCRRCESVCPAGLLPAEITIHARHDVVKKSRPSLLRRLVHRAMVGNRAVIAQLIGMASVLPGVSVKNGKPMRHLAEAASILSGNLSLPSGALRSFARPIPRHARPAAGVAVKGRIAIFPGCVFEFFMAEIARDMITALARAGFEVYFPQGLSCCGHAVYSDGEFKTARLMAERNIRVLSNFDRVVTGCATCGSALKGYAGWFEKNDPMHGLAADLARRSVDFTQLLHAADFKPPEPAGIGRSVTYHDPCHMRWHQGISESPRRLLQSISGISYREMEGADACCGLGGAFGLTHRQIGLRLLDEKMTAIRRSGAQTVVTACPGCLLHLKAGARRHHLPVQVLHISRLMAGPNP
ncbi:MAG: (Fe-S)-binding protein [Deltaproteobacteria bacterium]|nr:(Fe-S)-binding protein [Deltaproteobacteria bacterium]